MTTGDVKRNKKNRSMKKLPCIIYILLHLTPSTSVSGVKVSGKTSDDAFRSMDGDGGWGCFDVIINYVYRTIISCNVNSPYTARLLRIVLQILPFFQYKGARKQFFFFLKIFYTKLASILYDFSFLNKNNISF